MRKMLKNVFTDPLTSGIFSTLQALNVPWKNDMFRRIWILLLLRASDSVTYHRWLIFS